MWVYRIPVYKKIIEYNACNRDVNFNIILIPTKL